MAALPDLNTAEGLAAAVAALDPDFHGLLERKEVSQLVQGRLSNANVKSISRFAAVGDARADIRTFCTGTADVVEIAGVVDTWQASKARMETRHQAEAEASLASMPSPVKKVEAQDLRQKFEQLHYKLEDKVSPATSTMELIFDQVESGEWKAMSLVQFLSRDDTGERWRSGKDMGSQSHRRLQRSWDRGLSWWAMRTSWLSWSFLTRRCYNSWRRTTSTSFVITC